MNIETTIHLNEKQSPLLQGAEVTITCFDTAKHSYNIELKGPPEAVALFQQNLEQLKKSFQKREEENKTGKKEFDFISNVCMPVEFCRFTKSFNGR